MNRCPWSRIKALYDRFNRAERTACMAITLVLILAAFFLILSVRGSSSYDVNLSAVKETSDDDGTRHLLLRGLSLPAGTYTIDAGYVSDGPANIEISLDNDTYRSEELPGTDETGMARNYMFDLKMGTDRGRIDINIPPGSAFDIVYITIGSDKPIYLDGIIWGILVLLAIPFVWTIADRIRRSPYRIPLLTVIFVAVIEILPFILWQGLNLGTDTRGQMMRVEGVFYGLMDGQFPVVVYPEWNNSYGQIGVLYPNLFLYIPALARLAGMSQLGACKLFIFILICGTLITAYLASKSVFSETGDIKIRAYQMSLTILLIGLDGIRLINMLDDGRITGALIAEMFYPLVVAGLVSLFFGDRKKWYYLSYGIAGILCSHIMSATLVFLVTAFFTIWCIRKLKDAHLWAAIGKAAAIAILLSLGCALPFLKFFFGDWGKDKLMWEDFVSTLYRAGNGAEAGKWTFIILLAAVAIYLVIIMVKQGRAVSIKGTFVIPALICGTILFLMSTAAFPWGALRNISVVRIYTDMVQNAYRFLSLASCMLSFAIPAMIGTVYGSRGEGSRAGRRLALAGAALCIAACMYNYISANHVFFIRNDTRLYYDAFIGEMESQVEDYLPAGTLTEWYASDTGYISDEDAVTSISYERYGTHVDYYYTNKKEGAYAEFPRFYYDGYRALDENGDRLEVVKGDRNRTRVSLKKTDTPAAVRLSYRPAWWMSVAFGVSSLLWLLTGAALIFLWFWPGSGILRLWKRSDTEQKI